MKQLTLPAAPGCFIFHLDLRQRSMLVYVYTYTPTFQLTNIPIDQCRSRDQNKLTSICVEQLIGLCLILPACTGQWYNVSVSRCHCVNVSRVLCSCPLLLPIRLNAIRFLTYTMHVHLKRKIEPEHANMRIEMNIPL